MAAIRRPVTTMVVPKRLGNEHLHRFADHLFSRPPEHELSLGIRGPDEAIGTHQENRVRRGFEDRLEVASVSKLADRSLLPTQVLVPDARPPGDKCEPPVVDPSYRVWVAETTTRADGAHSKRSQERAATGGTLVAA